MSSKKQKASARLNDAFENVSEELTELSERIKCLSENRMFTKNDRQNLSISSNYIGAAIRVIEDVFESEEWNDNKN